MGSENLVSLYFLFVVFYVNQIFVGYIYGLSHFAASIQPQFFSYVYGKFVRHDVYYSYEVHTKLHPK